MPLGLDGVFGLQETALLARAKRAEILSNNMANADTPGFRAEDIDFKATLAQATQNIGGLKSTQAGHIQGSGHSGMSNLVMEYRKPLMNSLDGNTVDRQVEAAKFTENALQYQTTLKFMNGRIKNLLSAIKGD